MLIQSVDDGDEVKDIRPENAAKILAANINSQKMAVKLFVGAGARLLFYPTLLYNVIRNKFEPEFRWWDEIDQFLLLGAVPFPKDVFRLKDLGVEAVVTLNESFETLVSASLYKSQMIKHLVIPTQDYLFAPSFEDIERAVDFIHENAQQAKTTYVHCKAGRGRSTTIVLCYLVKYRGMTPLDAFKYVRSKRPRVLLTTSQWKAVLWYRDFQYIAKKGSLAALFLPNLTFTQPHDALKEQLFENEASCCGECPVFITLSDLEGYKEASEVNLVAYKVGLMAAKSVVGVAKASAALARWSCIWLRCQAGNQVSNMTLSYGKHFNVGTDFSAAEVVQHPVMSVHVCQQGLVEC